MTIVISFVAAAGTLLQLSAARFDAVEEMRIGTGQGPEYELTAVRSLVLDRAAQLYVLLPRDNEVRVFSPAGRFLRRIGRKGQGPGEFEWPNSMGWRGDTLWVRDTDLDRVTLFDSAGKSVRTLTLRMPSLGGSYVLGPPAALLADGSLLGVGDAPSTLVVNGRITSVPMVRFDESSAGRKVLRELSLANLYGDVLPASNRPGIQFVQRLADAPLWDVAADGSGIVVVDRLASTRPGPAQFRVTVYDPSGDVRAERAIDYTPVRVSGAFRDSVITHTLNPQRRPNFDYPSDAVYLPAFRPPVTDVVLTRDGRIWLRREFGFGVTREWDVLDARLIPVARVKLPADLQVLEATVNAVWGSGSDPDGAPYIARYRLVRQPGARP